LKTFGTFIRQSDAPVQIHGGEQDRSSRVSKAAGRAREIFFVHDLGLCGSNEGRRKARGGKLRFLGVGSKFRAEIGEKIDVRRA